MVLELTFVIWYLSVAAVRRLIYSLTIANLLQNSSGQLTQTCPALAIKTTTILELVSREN